MNIQLILLNVDTLRQADNSGKVMTYNTCQVLLNNPENVNQSLNAIHAIAQAIVDVEVTDVETGFGLLNEPTGFGLLNEPYADCLQSHYHQFVQHSYQICSKPISSMMVIVGWILGITRTLSWIHITTKYLISPPSTYHHDSTLLLPVQITITAPHFAAIGMGHIANNHWPVFHT
jgi:hypothetical protein